MTNEENQNGEPQTEGNPADDFKSPSDDGVGSAGESNTLGDAIPGDSVEDDAGTPDTSGLEDIAGAPVETVAGNEPGKATIPTATPAGPPGSEAMKDAKAVPVAQAGTDIVERIMTAIKIDVKNTIADAKRFEHWTEAEIKELIEQVTELHLNL